MTRAVERPFGVRAVGVVMAIVRIISVITGQSLHMTFTYI